MAAIRCKHEALVVLGVNSFVIYDKGSETELEIPVKCQAVETNEEENKQRQDVSKVDNSVLASVFSPSGKYFAIGDNAKQLHLYSVNPDWKLLSTRSLAKKCTALAFTHSEGELVVADRTGDVYRFPVLEPEEAGSLLMGHLSMVLDVVVTSDDKYLVTCDRDEKVRISCFPNAYNIHTYCLLHTEYVSQVVYIEKPRCLLSGGGDGRIAVWDMAGSCLDYVLEEDRCAGDQSDSQDQRVEQREPLSVKRLVYDDQSSVVAAIFFRSRRLHFYTLQSEQSRLKLTRRKEVELAGEPWDIEFGAQHRLWVLQPCENNCVLVYTCKTAGDQLQVTELDGQESVDCVAKKLNERWNLLKDAVDWRTEFINLSKTKHDNVQKYLEKKEQRLKGTKLEEPPEKKLKSSG